MLITAIKAIMKKRNPIARNAWKANQVKIFRDRKKYSRKVKHVKQVRDI